MTPQAAEQLNDLIDFVTHNLQRTQRHARTLETVLPKIDDDAYLSQKEVYRAAIHNQHHVAEVLDALLKAIVNIAEELEKEDHIENLKLILTKPCKN